MREKTKQAKRLEDYEPGATKDEIMDALRKVASSPSSKSGKPLLSKDREDDNNGKTN